MGLVEVALVWGTFFELLRRPVFPLSFLGAILGVFLFGINLFYSLGVIDCTTWLLAYQEDILRLITVTFSLAIILVYLGTKWLNPKFRTLPYWTLPLPGTFLLKTISGYLLRNRSLNTGLILVLLLSHTLALVWPTLSLPTSIFFLTLSLLDLWRLFYHNYWIFSIMAFSFPNPLLSHQIIIGSIYFWSGLSKLFSAEFFDKVAPIVFKPLDSIPKALAKFFALSDRALNLLTLSLYFIGLLAESLMPIILFFPTLSGPTLRLLALAFNLFFHSHISWVYGYPRNRWSFIPWNMWCLLSSQIIFSPCWNNTQYALSVGFTTFHWVLTAIFFLIPFSALFGICPNYCLSHFYFAPGYFGETYLFVSKEDFPKLPRSQFGGALPFTIPPSDSDKLQNGSHPAFIVLEGLLNSDGFNKLLKCNVLLGDLRASDLIGIGNDWLNETFNLGREDPFEESYGPLRQSLCEEILRVRGIKWGIMLSKANYSILSGLKETWAAKLLLPPQ